MAALDSLTELSNILEEWNTENATAGFATSNPVPKISRLAELVEHETEAYYKMDPDPFDDRHPGRANPSCTLGHLFKGLFKNEEFMNRFVCEYMLGHHGNNELIAISARLLLAVLPGVEKSDIYKDTLVVSYVLNAQRDVTIQTIACRLLYDILPGLETTVIFLETEGLVDQLFKWAEKADEPLKTYATGLLAGAMDIQEVASKFKEKNSLLVPVMLQRLHSLQREMHEQFVKIEVNRHDDTKHFNLFGSPDKHGTLPMQDSSSDNNKSSYKSKMSPVKESVLQNQLLAKKENEHNGDLKEIETEHLNNGHDKVDTNECLDNNTQSDKCSNDPGKTVRVSKSQTPCSSKNLHDLYTASDKPQLDNAESDEQSDSEDDVKEDRTVEDRRARLKRSLSPSYYSEDVYRLKQQRTRNNSFLVSDVSNSSWAEIQPYIIGSYSLDPLTLGMKQRVILQYLSPMGEYQELISAAFEHKAMDLVFYYINLKYNRDVRLAFEALKYLAVLLCHKKFAIEFFNRSGVQKLLDVYRPSIAATGVSLCLYYLAYFEDAMERVCLLPDHILTTLVNYVLWLLECSHDSSRCHAAMFFTQAFPYLVILNKFDTHDGLRRLYNVISTLGIMNIESNTDLNEDQVFTMRQSARHVCVALKRYFEAHLILKVCELKRSHTRTEGGSPHHELPAYKGLKITTELVQESIETMMELMPIRQQWQPEATFHKLGGVTLLTQLVAMAPEWSNYTGKPETIRAALDVISICCVTTRSQLQLRAAIPLPDNVTTPAISILISLAEGEAFVDPDVQKAALSVIINCVCGPLERLGGGVGRYMGSGSKKKVNWKLGEDILAKMWNAVRENNGIMVLLKLLLVKTPITDADSIRALACKALMGMARSETVRQIISKLPLFTNGQLQSLMKEPVLQDKHQDHVKFCRYATELIERVSGKMNHKCSDASLDDIRKADIVAQSKITYNEKELLQLIHGHLYNKGLFESAEVLQKEASLPPCNTPPPAHPITPHVFAPLHNSVSQNMFTPAQSSVITHRPQVRPAPTQPVQMSSSVSNQMFSQQPSTCVSGQAGVSHTPASQNSCLSTAPMSTTSSSQVHLTTLHTPTGPLRFSINRQSHLYSISSSTPHRTYQPRCKYFKERDMSMLSPAMRKGILQKTQADYEMSLDKIVTEYLRKQHALCRNPVVTCPPMSLFQPHRCPEPRGSSCAPLSFTSRTIKKMVHQDGGIDGKVLDRKFIYSRFKAMRTYKESEDDGFSCCTFANLKSTQSYLMLGTYGGNLKLVNIQSTEESGSFHCHSSPVTYCEHSRDSKLVLTASSYGIMFSSALWSWGSDTLNNVFNFEDHHLEFSNQVQDRLIGTKEEMANIYDLTTGENIVKLYDPDKANNYKANRAIFNPTDDLVLNDGVLWDVRLAKPIHKFDKFNQYISGVFHPVGLEIIINSEVWDIRSFHLLHTVPALDQCQIKFNHLGDVMYATRIDEELDNESERHNPYGSTFRTFDATNYSLIATMDVKSRSISDLCTDTLDTYLAVVENQQSTDIGSDENICRLYEIGKIKDEADDQQNEEEEEPVEDDDDDDDEDDDDDDDGDEFMLSGSADLSSGDEEEGGSDANDEETSDTEVEEVVPSGTDEDNDEDDDDDIDLDSAYFELATL